MKTAKTSYNSLEELRRDKVRLERRLSTVAHEMEDDIVDCFLPQDRAYVNSSVPYMRYMGYGITAYKTFNVVRKLVGMIQRWRWK